MLTAPEKHNSRGAIDFLDKCCNTSETCLRQVLKNKKFNHFLSVCAEKLPEELGPLLSKATQKCERARAQKLQEERENIRKRVIDPQSESSPAKRPRIPSALGEETPESSANEADTNVKVCHREERHHNGC